MSDIKYEIIKKVGVLSKSTSGWAKTPFVLRTLPPNQNPNLGEDVQPD